MAQYKLSSVIKKEVSTKYGPKAQIKCTLRSYTLEKTSPNHLNQIVDLTVLGEEILDVTIWSTFANFANLKDDDVVTGDLEIKQNGQYVNKTLKMPQITQEGGKFGATGAFRTKQIAESMQVKAENIRAAQDRSAWMWSKTNASTLLADGRFQGMSLDSITDAVIRLATKIYNAEPIEPFSTPPKRIPDERVVEEDRNITPEDIDAQFNRM